MAKRTQNVEGVGKPSIEAPPAEEPTPAPIPEGVETVPAAEPAPATPAPAEGSRPLTEMLSAPELQRKDNVDSIVSRGTAFTLRSTTGQVERVMHSIDPRGQIHWIEVPPTPTLLSGEIAILALTHGEGRIEEVPRAT